MTKISIVSGFLGAGKTTLIKKLLEEVFQNEKIAIIENEFGDVGIDGGFLKNTGIQVTEMNSGCICCSLVGDFGKNMREVIAEYQPEHIIVEPSGVGKLSDVMKSVIELESEMDVQLSALITVVNGKKCLKQMKAFGEFFNNQIEHASIIVLSRTQEMTEDQLDQVINAIQEKNTNVAIITTPWDQLNGKQILNAVEEKNKFMNSVMKEVEKTNELNHEHDHHESSCGCGNHDHHDHHESSCGCGNNDHHESSCGCGNHDHHDHHDSNCQCGNHDHHDHHHADEVFVNWGIETPHKFEKAKIINALEILTNNPIYDHTILRAKGMVPVEDGSWVYFDMVPGDFELRAGEPAYIGKIVVIGTAVEEPIMRKLFGLE